MSEDSHPFPKTTHGEYSSEDRWAAQQLNLIDKIQASCGQSELNRWTSKRDYSTEVLY